MALIDSSKSSTHSVSNLNPCFRKISIDVRKCSANNSAINIYSRTAIYNIIFDGTIDERLYKYPPMFKTQYEEGGKNKYKYTSEISGSYVYRPYYMVGAYNLSGNDITEYVGNNGSVSTENDYEKITTTYLIQTHNEAVSFRECVF